jgi:hypothetical protein
MSFLQIIMPLIICAALLAYWSWRQHGRILSLVVLCALWLIGPWAREILFVVPLLIGYLELEQAKRPTWLMFFACLAFTHALYPTALLKLIFFPALPLCSMFEMGGHVTQQMAGEPLRWQAGLHFLPLLPPSLWLLAMGAAVLVPTAPSPSSVLHWSRVLLPPPVAVLAGGLALIGSPGAGAVFCLMIPALAWRHGTPFLAGWFLILFLPILRVFTEHIHFLYALLPACIILTATVERLCNALAAQRLALAGLRHAVVVVALVAAADQALTLYGTHRTMHATYEGIEAVAGRLRSKLRCDDVLVANALHGEEIWYHAGYSYRNLMSIPWGIPDQRRCVADPQSFQKLLQERSRGDVYLLDIDFEYLPGKRGHRHKYVHSYELAKHDLGQLHQTRQWYPYCDPLRALIPREYVPFLGAPDLVNDFYCGPAQDGCWFCYEVFAAYRLYRVEGKALTPVLDGPVALVVEDVQGFNILRIGELYLAFPQAYGAFELEKYRRGEYGANCITGLSVEAVRQKILCAP